MTGVKNIQSGIFAIAAIFIGALLYFPVATWGAEAVPTGEGKTVIVYPTSRYLTFNAVCFRQPDCEQEVVSFLKNTPAITNVMSHSRQGAIRPTLKGERSSQRRSRRRF